MSEIDATIDQPPVDPAVPDPPLQQTEEPPAPEPQEPQHPDGDPRAAIVALRKEVQALKPLAQRAQTLESENQRLRELEPYAKFVQANPQLLQPQAPPPPAPTADPKLEQIARRYELYTADGKPDVERARAIQSDMAETAREEARKIVAPIETQTLSQRAAANLQWIGQQKDPYGRPITEQAIQAAIAPLVQGMSEAQRIQAMADPKVTQLILQHAKVAQIEQMPHTPVQAPQNPPLHIETAGGGSRITLSETDKRLGARAGLNEQQLRDRASKFNVNGPNVLE